VLKYKKKNISFKKIIFLIFSEKWRENLLMVRNAFRNSCLPIPFLLLIIYLVQEYGQEASM
jgi:hypothetical protein